MNSSCLRSLAIGLALFGGTQLTLKADPYVFNQDDLLLGFQATTGTGSSKNVFVNLGKTTDFLSNGNRGIITNIGEVLEDAYGEDWFDREEIKFGVAGNRDYLDPLFAPAPGAGEESTRTWYISRAVASPGASLPLPSKGGASLGVGGSKFLGLKRVFRNPTSGEQLQEVAEGVTVLDQSLQPVAWNNSWSTWNTPQNSFEIWDNATQNSFGKEGSKVSLDVQRMVPATVGEYVVTISISSDGTITAEGPAVIQPIPAFVDSDNDGLSDFLEDLLVDYGFDKNVSQTALVQQFLTSQGFYTEDSIGDLRTANQVIIEATGNDVNLSLPVFRSGDLQDFSDFAGNLMMTIPKDGDKQFYRIEIPSAE